MIIIDINSFDSGKKKCIVCNSKRFCKIKENNIHYFATDDFYDGAYLHLVCFKCNMFFITNFNSFVIIIDSYKIFITSDGTVIYKSKLNEKMTLGTNIYKDGVLLENISQIELKECVGFTSKDDIESYLENLVFQ